MPPSHDHLSCQQTYKPPSLLCLLTALYFFPPQGQPWRSGRLWRGQRSSAAGRSPQRSACHSSSSTRRRRWELKEIRHLSACVALLLLHDSKNSSFAGFECRGKKETFHFCVWNFMFHLERLKKKFKLWDLSLSDMKNPTKQRGSASQDMSHLESGMCFSSSANCVHCLFFSHCWMFPLFWTRWKGEFNWFSNICWAVMK